MFTIDATDIPNAVIKTTGAASETTSTCLDVGQCQLIVPVPEPASLSLLGAAGLLLLTRRRVSRD